METKNNINLVLKFNDVFLGFFWLTRTQPNKSASSRNKLSFEQCVLVGWHEISGVVQLEDAPRTGTMEHLILGRITTVSANVQEGNKERLGLQILMTIKICDIKLLSE
jgi:hypothetical protein